MKSDLDNLMDGRGFDALVVTGPTNNNPVMYYLANGAKIGEGTSGLCRAALHRHDPPIGG